MRYWYDCEFLEDGRTIAPISIGIVADDGTEYYAIDINAPWERIADHPWVVGNVIPHLPQLPADQRTIDLDWVRLGVDLSDPAVKPLWRIAAEVREFLTRHNGPVELWGYYSSYDHILLSQLWGRMIDRPDRIPMITLDVQQEAIRLGLENSLPRQADGLHNALADARWTRDAWQYLRWASAGMSQ